MIRTIALFLMTCFCLSVAAMSGDLYKVSINSHADADRLTAAGAEPLLLVKNGYLVLADADQTARLAASGLEITLLARDITKENLALDNRRDDRNVGRFPLVFQQDEVRLFRVDGAKAMMSDDGSSLIPIRNDHVTIRYREPLYLTTAAAFQADGLVELIDRVSYDSVYSQLYRLQAYNGRVAGSSSSYAARDWIRNKFISYGYTSVTLQSFWAYVYTGWKECFNIVATKPGTTFPKRQVVIGAHYDAVPGSPGADDNGTGTVGVLEIARVLASVETDMSFIFILFDSEEQGLNGAWNYASAAAGRGDSIICMLNMDMIGHLTNNNFASLMFGPEDAYARLWLVLADSLLNLTGNLAGSSSRSDHYPFEQNGYDVLYTSEYDFSTVYHTPRDSTTFVNFNYCTKLIKSVLATADVINVSPMPVRMVSIRDGGDGQSLLASWRADDPGNIVGYRVYYQPEPDGPLDSVIVASTDTSALLTGLTEGQEYGVYAVGLDNAGYASIVHTKLYGTPRSRPVRPESFAVLPEYHSIRVSWTADNTELDFSHYGIIRDGQLLPLVVTDSFYVDNDFSLGSDFHSYLVVAVDKGGLISDTAGVIPYRMRAATLEPGHILAVNRSNNSGPYMVNEVVTGQFMRDALDGYNYDYLSDTARTNGADSHKVNLVDMLDYEVIVFGGEAARTDDFAGDPLFGGILDTIAYYLSIGGKVVLFGRFGNITTTPTIADTVIFSAAAHNLEYHTWFHMTHRVQYLSTLNSTTINSDLIGAHSLAPEFPALVWDSLATVNHSSPFKDVGGIPCPSFAAMAGGEPEILYTYDSRNNVPFTEGKPVAWRYTGSDYQYVFFEIPLSFFERASAKLAIQTALAGMLSSGPAAATRIEPDSLDLANNPPATTVVYLGDFGDGKTADDVSQFTVRINGGIVPQTVSVLPSYPGFTGNVLEVAVSTAALLASYGTVVDTAGKVYTVSWQYGGSPATRIIYGHITLIGQTFVWGDANGDHIVNVGDAAFLVNYVFKGGLAPEPLEAGDANCDGSTNVGDAVYLISYIFNGGSPPGCE